MKQLQHLKSFCKNIVFLYLSLTSETETLAGARTLQFNVKSMHRTTLVSHILTVK